MFSLLNNLAKMSNVVAWVISVSIARTPSPWPEPDVTLLIEQQNYTCISEDEDGYQFVWDDCKGISNEVSFSTQH